MLEPDVMLERLAVFIAEREGLPPDAVRVSGLRRLAGGASRLLWSLDVEIESAGASRKLALVLRQDPPGRIAVGGMALEFALLQAAAERGVPVPAVQWCEPGAERLGAPFFSMQRLTGEAIPKRLLRDERFASLRRQLPHRLGEILARIHRIDIDAPELADRLQRPAAGTSPALAEIERLAAGYRGLAVEPHPVLDLAERWLRRHAPASDRLSLVHGDYRMGNLLCDERDVVGVLDWELAHVGDPVEDLAWLCLRAWRFGNDQLAAGGVTTREQLIESYEADGGAPVDAARLRFWEVVGNFKLALVFITQARAYLDGAHPSVELASLGRRTAEGERELLELIR